MSIALSCETTVDLPKDMLEKFNVHTIPFTITLGDTQVLDKEGIREKIFDFVAKTKELPKTSAINEEDYYNYFSKLLGEYDEVIHVTLSSKISCTYENAVNASKKFDGKVRVVDSLSLSTGIALLVLYARKLIDKNLPLEEVARGVEKRVPFVQASFYVKTLDYLYKGGRCSGLAYFGANLLKIKPQILVTNGEMHPGKKFFGLLSNVTKSYFNETFKQFKNPDLENVFITYTTADEKDLEFIKKGLQEKGFKNIYLTQTGGTICSHCGPGTLGILFINDGAN